MSSFKQIKAFLETEDLKLSIRPNKSKTITWRFVPEADKIIYG